MLSRVGWKRHVIVAVAVLFVPLLVAIGWIGGGRYPERFDAKQVVVTPVGGDGVRIREIVDQDFGSNDRHGYQRIIPNDFGSPTDVEAFTYDEEIPAELWISDFGFETQIRIGSPDVTADGQHRFELSYTLPEARLSTGELALDIIGTEETLETGRFEVVLDGFRLEDPTCNVDALGAVGGCELVADGDLYRVVFEPLRPGQGITVGGRITGLVEPSGVAEPAMLEHRGSRRLLGVGVLALVGLVTAVIVYVVQARRGRNVVGGAAAADAAFGPDGPTRLVTDRELESMATNEFEPPRDLHPWQGAVLLDEAVTTRSVSAWFAEQIAKDVLSLDDDHGLRLRKGDKWRETDITTMDMVRDLFDSGDELVLSRYQPSLGKLWERLLRDQRSHAKKAHWWDRGGALGSAIDTAALSILYVVVAPILLIGSIVLGALGFLASWIVCGILTVGVVTLTAVGAYAVLSARRSAEGSALALRTESFRRFLAASEGQHVDWAWERGVVREYTAWAVALGAAAAWGRAIDQSAVAPQVNQMLVTPALFERQLSSIESARTPPPPPSSSSGGSSGSSWSSSSSFSSGSVGGGGGGGSSGSW